MANFCHLCIFSNCNNFHWLCQKLIYLMLTKNFITEKRLTYNIPRFQVLRAIHDWHHLLVLLPLAYILCLPLSLSWTSIIKHEQISLPRKFKYRISSYSFRGNYSFLNLETQRSQYIRPKVTVQKGAETIQGRKLFKGGNYMRKYGMCIFYKGCMSKCRHLKIKNHIT